MSTSGRRAEKQSYSITPDFDKTQPILWFRIQFLTFSRLFWGLNNPLEHVRPISGRFEGDPKAAFGKASDLLLLKVSNGMPRVLQLLPLWTARSGSLYNRPHMFPEAELSLRLWPKGLFQAAAMSILVGQTQLHQVMHKLAQTLGTYIMQNNISSYVHCTSRVVHIESPLPHSRCEPNRMNRAAWYPNGLRRSMQFARSLRCRDRLRIIESLCATRNGCL